MKVKYAPAKVEKLFSFGKHITKKDGLICDSPDTNYEKLVVRGILSKTILDDNGNPIEGKVLVPKTNRPSPVKKTMAGKPPTANPVINKPTVAPKTMGNKKPVVPVNPNAPKMTEVVKPEPKPEVKVEEAPKNEVVKPEVKVEEVLKG